MIHAGHFFWKQVPFFRIVLPFTAGILAAIYFPVLYPFLYSFIFVSTGLLLCNFILPYNQVFRLRVLTGLNVQLLLAVTGALLLYHRDRRTSADWVGHEDHSQLIITTQARPQEKQRSWKIPTTIEFAGTGKTLNRCSGRLFLYLNKKVALPRIPPGSLLYVTKAATPIRPPGNPDAFDYGRYALYQGFTHQVFTDTGYKLLSEGPTFSLRSLLDNITARVITILRQYIPGVTQQGLAAALLIGYKEDLDDDLVKSYSATGVVHIIAISGLHLGLIYMILVLLLRPLRGSKSGRVLSAVFILCFLWLFTLLTGAQPSILRSAVMFSSLVMADIFSRRTSPFNSLAASAFVLLCINPYWILDAGFQLSYAALLGIMLFMKPVYHLLFVKNKLLDLAWQMTAVTLSAQVLTVPLTIFYFRQFPVMFLISNFLAVPLSSLILVTEIILCVCSPLPVLAPVVGRLTAILIDVMNAYIKGTEAIPFSSWQRLSISLPQAWLVCFIMLAVCSWLLFSKKNMLLPALWGVLAFLTIRGYSFYTRERQQSLVVYQVSRNRAAALLQGRSWAFIGDAQALREPLYSFNLLPHHTAARLHMQPAIMLTKKNCLLRWGKIHMMFISENKIPVNVCKPELLVISGNRMKSAASLLQRCKPQQVVFDATVPPWKAQKMREEFESNRIPVHVVSDAGAFVMSVR